MAAGVFQNLSKLQITSASGKYDIHFAPFHVGSNSNYYFLVDSFFQDAIKLDPGRVIYVDATEEAKTLGNVEKILIQLSTLEMTKQHSLVVIGGGCLQDIGTLVASLYMRGVEWTFVPTTLAAMGDSCIGGKSSINVGEVKNLVGNFYPPREVIIDSNLCITLPGLEMIAGISEVIKICYARSNQHFSHSVELASVPDLQKYPSKLDELINLSLSCKKYFIEEDEFDIGIRKLLNFGHSFGHALESTSGYQIPHGVAVMIGMIAATKHADAIKTAESDSLRHICLAFLKRVSPEIENSLEKLDLEGFGSAIERDKKNTKKDLVLILPGLKGLDIYAEAFASGAIQKAKNAMEMARIEVLNEIR
jgi:3-dehydroquinate synthase